MRRLLPTALLAVAISGPSDASTQGLDAAVMKATRFGMHPMPPADR